ncbi:DEAD/DEAH box helicase [Phenylobacterium sp.]|jgi:ATP-dependent RNA helicase DeaD|uniref:DEAD/DEAH box helicase n=1 Tax=Phenylobacterium sp. TaxID=1871053 RepID=UPI002F42BB58
MPFPPLHPTLAQALTTRGYAEPTPVQAAILGEDRGGRDLLVSAQTGSGKTVAFGLAAAADLLDGLEALGPAAEPLILVVAPTRELALQVERELAWLYAPAGGRVVSCVGGMDARREQRALAAGAHVVVATPGRLKDHIERGNIDLSGLRVVVLDEADEMLDLGFREDLEFILDATPDQRRTMLFSATIAKDIAALARRYQRDALRIDTTVANAPHGDIEYRAMRVAPGETEHAVVNVLRYFESPGALVFCATREAVRRLFTALRERGFEVVALSGELSQKERGDALQALRDGHARVCVATDVAARGIDLPDLGLVIHVDLPANRAGLLHRSGRTGRAGRKGASVLLVPYTKRRRAEQLLASANIEAAWSGPPSAEAIRVEDQRRLLEDPILAEPPGEDEAALVQALMSACAPEALAAAVIRLRRARLPAPEEVFDDGDRDARVPSHEPRSTYDPRAPRQADAGRRERPGPDEVIWFRLTVGRRNNADPKWLVPLICRLGHVTKKDIGEIRIFDRETKFGIVKAAEPKFSVAIQAAAEDDVRIEPAGAPPGPREPRRPDAEAPRKSPPWRPEGVGRPPQGPPRGPEGESPPRKPKPPRSGPPSGAKGKPKRRSNDRPKGR